MKDRPKIRLFNVINGILFILISIIMLIPIYKVLVDSFDLWYEIVAKAVWSGWICECTVKPDSVSSFVDFCWNNTGRYLPWSCTFHTWCIRSYSVGYAGKNILCKLPVVYHDLQWWYDPDLLGYEKFRFNQ